MPNITNPNIAWLILVVAGALEVVWSLSMKASEGYSRGWPTAVTLVAALLSFWLLGLSLRLLPVGTAYAVWTGIGAVGAAVFGVLIFNEPANAVRLGCIALILAGIIGLKITSAG